LQYVNFECIKYTKLFEKDVLSASFFFYYKEVIIMLQVYSSNLTVDANTVIPFNNVILDKGCGEILSAPSTI